ncbi:NFX1-type zinc finger-containing protein 1 [Podarcis raffonei]|uniref:NFX1-type zinc finger-containing protein 1 n=1 Tax=Podarcis raffonei TaxID=65483 RepID=UPI0023294286|nr:NFX1-type zinc finger-containing protein 1 [Podarcis raffonei]
MDGRGRGRGQPRRPRRGGGAGGRGREPQGGGAFQQNASGPREGGPGRAAERRAGSGRTPHQDGARNPSRLAEGAPRWLGAEGNRFPRRGGVWPGADPREERRAGGQNQGGPARDGPGRQREGPPNADPTQRPHAGPGGSPQQRGPMISTRFLRELLEKDPSEVAITLASSPRLREALSPVAMRPDLVQLLCQVLCKACLSRMDRQSIQRLLETVKESSFLRVCLPQYVADMLTEARPEVRHQCPQHIASVVALVQELVSIFPASSLQKVALLMSVLPGSVNGLRALGVDFPVELDQSLEKLQGFIQHLQERRREGTLRVDSCTLLQPTAPGEEGEYRAMSIYPTYEEVNRGQKPFLRPNLISQPYESPAVYLDTHFRLLREDFVRPLREGILQFLQSFEEAGPGRRRFDDIRVYLDARILAPLCSRTGIDYKVHFDSTPLGAVRWENSKRLLYGSLVCLSKDNFETFLFATVSDREPQELRKGFVHLSFATHSQALLAEVQPSDSFIMVETTAYFEAYRHVLQGLQELREEDVPFQRYIVHCEAQVREPAYLRREPGSSLYDLRCLMAKPPPAGAEGAPEGRVNVLDASQWPTQEAVGLDESQLQALKLALTKELAIIQGPPGTGKTYVGLKIMEVLLKNKAARGETPILVVCYTNHALDQFLEGIQAFQPTGIVRVGGRSNSEKLKPFTLQQLRGRSDFLRGLPGHLRWSYSDITCEMREAESELSRGAAQLECGLHGILHEKHLRSCISSRHWESLVRGLEEDWMDPKHSLILEWLGLGATPVENMADPGWPENAGVEEDQEAGEGPQTEPELLQVVEEADLIQRERLLDHDEDGRLRRRRPPRHNLDDLFLAMRLDDEEKGEQRAPHGAENAGFQLQPGRKKKMKRQAKAELKKWQAMTKEEAEAVLDVWQLNLSSRWKLYRYWLQKHQAEIQREMLQHKQKYQAAADRLAELRQHQDLCVFRTAQIVGMTTTGAARYRQVLQQVAPRVVIVEEAAEVLEAHVITTLSRACQHLILIGDHQQLRPSANVYDLARNFHLEVSLFERLVKVGLPFVRLAFQHRMRPEIAQLLTPHIYQDLENHPSVLRYENIKGVSSNLFFVEHSFLEQEIQEGRSHQNQHEAQFVVELCRYLLRQGYQPSQISILTTYTGQLFCLRRLLPAKEFQGVKVHVVDKYQGEENDIILLSLVRSNLAGRVGFLQIPNRICVALSRAKKGLYCVGNMGMLSQVPLWSRILHTLREKGHVGRALRLACQNHPQTKTDVVQAEDFRQVPEGGCSIPCDTRLGCGHVCPRACHPYDPQHKELRCLKPCQKVLCDNGHRCPWLCCEPCGKCQVKVPKTVPRCGHQQQVPCSMAAKDFCCKEPCGKTLECGHACRLTCGQQCERRCPELVLATLPCGHSQEVPCSAASEMAYGRPIRCNTKCDSILECGHPCPGSCHTCFGGRFHQPCRSPCKRPLVCGHQCRQPCTRDCPPCRQPCQNRCIHSRCPKQCGAPCSPCMEPCEWRCQHHQCGRLCSEPCDRPRCDVPCPKRLPCGHPCAGLCGEPCPQKCLTCDAEELTQIFFGCEDEPDARFVQLEDCGHIFSALGLDRYMDGDEEEEEGAVRLKVCPSCQTPVRKSLRYGTLVKRSLAEVEVVKGRMQGSSAEIASGALQLVRALQQETTLRRHLTRQHKQLRERLEDDSLSASTLGLVETLFGFYAQVAGLMANVGKLAQQEQEGVRRRLAEVAGWLDQPRDSFSGQQVSELRTELRRMTYLVELLARCSTAGEKASRAPGTVELVSAARKVLEGPGRFSPEAESEAKAKLKELEAALPTVAGLGISEEERKQIVAAVSGATRGHWFKCRNGHFYVIGECGGAMETTRCPECRETIGGERHTLESSNRLAPEMDGATHAAWSEETNRLNLNNYLH